MNRRILNFAICLCLFAFLLSGYALARAFVIIRNESGYDFEAKFVREWEDGKKELIDKKSINNMDEKTVDLPSEGAYRVYIKFTNEQGKPAYARGKLYRLSVPGRYKLTIMKIIGLGKSVEYIEPKIFEEIR